MSNNKIILSDGNGKYQEAPSSSFSVGDNTLTASAVIMQTASWTAQDITPVSGIFQSFEGNLKIIPATSALWQSYDQNNDSIPNDQFNPTNLSGTLFQYRKDYGGFGPHRISSASFNGDLIGSLSSSWPVKIISIANVTTGVLDSKFGGTQASSFENKAIVTLSGSLFTPSDALNSVIVSNSSNNWSLSNKISIEPSFSQLTQPLVYIYTGSIAPNTNASASTFTWNKPPNARFIRVICQGAGGGGGAAGTIGSQQGGGGGGGGGYCDVTFDATQIEPTVNITVGAGGLGVGGTGVVGGSGGSSSFGTYIYSSGGPGGDDGNPTPALAAASAGYNYLGGIGTTQGLGLVTISDVYLGGAGGGAGSSSTGKRGGNITYLSINGGAGGTGGTSPTNASNPSSGSAFNFSSVTINNISNQALPALIYGGGGGGGGSGTSGVSGKNGSSPFFGSGGGGAGRGTGAAVNGTGGNGGRGYVLIICT